MKILNLVFGVMVLMVASSVALGQEPAPTPPPTPAPTETTLVDRFAFSPNNGGYRLLEAYVTKGKWIPIDVGYIDFRNTRLYREFFWGGGAVLVDKDGNLIIGELYLDQATGPAAQSALYFQPWIFVKHSFTKKTSIEGVYFPYIPISKHAVAQHVLERIKLEHDFGRFKAGAGYGGYKFGSTSWSSRPFVSVTLKTKKFGNFEVWGQKSPSGGQIQIRHDISFHR